MEEGVAVSVMLFVVSKSCEFIVIASKTKQEKRSFMVYC